MSTLQQLRHGLNRAWDHIAEGWRELSERAGHALTRFRPYSHQGELETADEQVLQNASRWGLLAAEVRETADAVEVRLEAPGLEPDDFEIEVADGDVLVVRGEKRLERRRQEGHYSIMERAFGRFERAIPLPVAVEEDGAKARYRRGVLTVELPKSRSGRLRRIPVRTG